MKNLLVIFIMLPGLAYADTSIINQGANAINPPVSGNGAQALQKAEEASLMQLGITQKANQLQNKYVHEIDMDAQNFIDNNLPINHEKVYFLLGAGYVLTQQHQVQGEFDCPVLPHVKNVISVNQNSGNLMFKYSF